MIILAVKSFFFSGLNSYSLRQKPHTSYFFFSFYGEIIKLVCAILAIAVEDLEVCYDNANLFLGKSTIWFGPLAQKGETDKQTTDVLYNKY